MIVQSTFKPAWWLQNAHAQTIYPTLVRRRQAPIDKVECFKLSDGDFLEIAWAINGLNADSPLIVLLHGLGGNVHSAYVGGLLHAFNQRGWRSVLMHFRGAGDQPNLMPRAYHSGDTSDLNEFMHGLQQREPHTKKAVVGISLGGNVLLKWLGERGRQSIINVGVAVSVPFQLRLAADKMNRGVSRIYQTYLLREMKLIYARLQKIHAGKYPFLNNPVDACRCFWTFDERVTAPMHGFANVHAYYREASSRFYLASIKTPTLILHALDDPFMPPTILPNAAELSSTTILEVSRRGGHVGFIYGQVPGVPKYWLDERIPNHLQHYLS